MRVHVVVDQLRLESAADKLLSFHLLFLLFQSHLGLLPLSDESVG
jgi:hypothetical protein